MRISDWSSDVCSSDLDRLVSGLVIAGDIGEARGEPAAPPARLAFGAEHPAADLDRFLPGQCRGEHAVGGVPQMMALVDDQPRRGGAAVTRARPLDRKSVVSGTSGAVSVGLGRRRSMKKNTRPIMRS